MPHSIFNSSFRPALIGPLLNAAFSTFILQSKLAPTTWTLNSWLLLHLGSFPLPRLRPFRVRPLYHNAEAAEPARFSGAYSYALLSIRELWKPVLEIVRESEITRTHVWIMTNRLIDLDRDGILIPELLVRWEGCTENSRWYSTE